MEASTPGNPPEFGPQRTLGRDIYGPSRRLHALLCRPIRRRCRTLSRGATQYQVGVGWDAHGAVAPLGRNPSGDLPVTDAGSIVVSLCSRRADRSALGVGCCIHNDTVGRRSAPSSASPGSPHPQPLTDHPAERFVATGHYSRPEVMAWCETTMWIMCLPPRQRQAVWSRSLPTMSKCVAPKPRRRPCATTPRPAMAPNPGVASLSLPGVSQSAGDPENCSPHPIRRIPHFNFGVVVP